MRASTKYYRAAIYLRLSKEDGDFFGSGKKESDSIANQRDLIRRFLQEHPEIMTCAEYVDDGYTGTNFDRPDFQKMMQSVQSGEINCILVKDFSRFGREYIETGRYLEKIFPQLGVRFISVNDNYDSAAPASMADSIVLPFKNLINDSYSHDTSIKTRTNLEAMRKSGRFVANFAVYGYMRSPTDKHRLEIDETAAAVVRDIYRWKIEGWSVNRIAEHLNLRGILAPLPYKRANGSRYTTSFQMNAHTKWSYVSVKRILSNEIYTGTLVQGKRTTPSYKVKKLVVKEESEWARVENAHEAIISREQFELVQQLLLEDTRTGPEEKTVALFAGRIFCGDCGSPMNRKIVDGGVKKYVYYLCAANKANRRACSAHLIPEKQLEEVVLATIQTQIKLLLDMERALKNTETLFWEQRELKKIDANIRLQEEAIEKNERLKHDIYADLKDGLLEQEDYEKLKEGYSLRIAEARDALRRYESDRRMIREGAKNQQGWLAGFRKYRNITKLNRSVIVHLIARINVYEGKQIEVVFRQKDQFADMQEFMQEYREKTGKEVV